MLTPWNIYCEGARLRGVLKHAWIENEIEKITPERAVQRCTRPEGWLKLETEFPVRIQWTRELAARLPELFSPAQLIDQCAAFAHLNEETKRGIREAVHQAYLESSGIEAGIEPLVGAADGLESALQAFRVACAKYKPPDPKASQDAWGEVLKAAAELRKLLDGLPKGVVFP